MFLYPIHQSMGQIGSTVLYATERTRLQVIAGILTMIVGMLMSYFVLAPRTATVPGLGLASQGLAVKMVAIQFVSVNVIAYLISRLWDMPFDWLYQPVSLLGCLAMGWMAHAVSLILLGESPHVVLRMGLAGVAYVMFVVAFIYTLPWAAGLTRAELLNDLRKALRSVGRLRYQRPTARPKPGHLR
jgi:peptidoglycan biosynthesis protein MviN/MurJ (putative lipid II flippase)